MEVQQQKKIKASRKILSFVRNERERGKECQVIHRSEEGIKEMPMKPQSDFDKMMDKTRICDGVLHEDEFEDVQKVYEEVKKYIYGKHGSTFKPSEEEVKRFMDAYLSEKNRKATKNSFNGYLSTKLIREEYIRIKLEQTQERKRKQNFGTTAHHSFSQQPHDVELDVKDQIMFDHMQKSYIQRPYSVNVNKRLQQYQINKFTLARGCQDIKKQCNDLIRDHLFSKKLEDHEENQSQADNNNTFNESLLYDQNKFHTISQFDSSIPQNKLSQITVRNDFNQTNEKSILHNSNHGQNFATERTYNQQINKNEFSARKVRNINSEVKNRASSAIIQSEIPYKKDERSLETKKVENNKKRLNKSHLVENSIDLNLYNIQEKWQIDMRDLSNTEIPDKEKMKSNGMQDKLLTDNKMRGDNSENSQSEQNEMLQSKLSQQKRLEDGDSFVRKAMISMISGKPIKPYLQLTSLSEKIETKGTEKKQRDRLKVLDESKLKKMEEFKNFNFYGEHKVQNQNPSGHQNMNSSSISNGAQTVPYNATVASSAFKQTTVPTTGNSNSIYNNTEISSLPQNQMRAKKNLTCSFKNQNEQIPSVKVSAYGKRVQSLQDTNTNETSQFISKTKSEQSTSPQFSKNNIQYPSISSSPSINEIKNETQILSVNSQVLGRYSKLVNKIKTLRGELNCRGQFWEEMRHLEEQITECGEQQEKQELRRRQKRLGRQQYKILQQKQEEDQEERAIRFEQLVANTIKCEHKLIEQFEEIKKTKYRKNLEFRALIDTFERDLKLTRELRKRNYDFSHNQNEQIVETNKSQKNKYRTLEEVRKGAERDRKKVLQSELLQVDWYKNTVNKLSCLALNSQDTQICYILMDGIKQKLEDGIPLEIQHVEHLLNIIEDDPLMKYTVNSLYCAKIILQLFSLLPSNLPCFQKLLLASQNQNLGKKGNKSS